MPNEQNLVPMDQRTKEEATELGREGGRASGIARRRKRSLREAADLYLSLPVADRKSWNKIAREGVDPEDIDNPMAMIIGLTQQAMKGDAKAAKVIVDLIGEAPNNGNGMPEIEDDEITKAIKEDLKDGLF